VGHMIRIYAYFNNQDESGRVIPRGSGSLDSLRAHEGQVAVGQRVILCMDDSLEVEGVLERDDIQRVWFAVPDYTTLVRFDTGASAKPAGEGNP